ncbi:hypothetical protein [Nostoc commune]|uniref:hypothetical protein n=1 Tax=Nostoc commune TaxID=1178 RepID=UPI0018C5ECEE|nr:hypothetical protein [Nostoc commune]
MEQEIKNAVGLGSPELVIESKPKPEPEPKPTVTIYLVLCYPNTNRRKNRDEHKTIDS